VRESLARADAVLAEDTRRAGILCRRLGVETKRFISFYEQNEAARTGQALELLHQGQTLALISDAGTPVLSDPGYQLVRACREAGIRVTPVPGPFAPAAALSACGLAPMPFSFLGFLPRKTGEARRVLESFAAVPGSLVLFERKNRVGETLALAHEVLGEREFCVARELTKEHEEFIFGRLGRGLEGDRELLGEVTLVIGPPAQAADLDEAAVAALIERERAADEKPRETAKRIAALAPGWTAKQIYALMQRSSRES
jgi:16S rRNA (cytidine1402-2'-O)-methyltransferase